MGRSKPRPSEARRAALKQSELNKIPNISNLTPIQRYYSSALKLLQRFYTAVDNNKLDEAYIYFMRACKAGIWQSCARQTIVLVSQNRTTEAQQLLDNIENTVPENDDSKLLLAQIYIQLNHSAQAENLVRKILINDPINQEAKQLLTEITLRR